MSRLIKFGVFGTALMLITGRMVGAPQGGTQGAGAQQGQPGAVGNAQTPATGTSANGNGGITQNPWHSGMQQQFNFTPQQTQQLNSAYSNQYNRYQQQVAALPNNLSADERQQRLNSLRQDFYNNYNNATASVFSSPDQRSRYNQVFLQYRGYNAFEDPNVQQKLNLTNAQKQQLTQFDQNWNAQMDAIRAQYKTNPNAARQAFDRLQQESQQNLSTVLSPSQMGQWRQVIGNPYSFEASQYMQTTPSPTRRGNSTNPG
jgi:hypothetical protein